ncbi:hypothetical protein DFQ28_003656 [Apophysomyces sp. BC1034]|nr:hypothetical protein DFQ30_001819 [Apophysomyces sp. BC1015]KAG0182927.1 hypothetical protein DFQ29_001365 [Apophysomyces sp. BC1021]KAG0193736.1 hypothetical protein DFQ28_003656 [Apophysomyces sp. BC1034]
MLSRSHVLSSFVLRRQARAFTTVNRPVAKGWRKYAQQFRDKPASYMTTFAVLHEITAIVPFPVIYYMLDHVSWEVPVPEEAVAEGNRIMNKLRTRYGYEPLEPQNRVMVNLATTYAIVKVLMPVRVMASVTLTPFFAERLVGPVLVSVRRWFKRS